MDHSKLFPSYSLTVTGLVESVGEWHLVAIPVPLIVQNGALWLAHLAERFLEESEIPRVETQNDYLAMANTLWEASSGMRLRVDFPLANIRLSLRPLVFPAGGYANFRNMLIQFCEPAFGEPEVRLTPTVMEVSPRLSWLSDFMSCSEFGLYKPEHAISQA